VKIMTRSYASAVTCTAKDERIVLCLYGPRGGTQFLGGLTLDGARALIDGLQCAVREFELSLTKV
jgi:hypothetical protein